LDNREDLAVRLWRSASVAEDADLALAAYKAWGVEGLAQLVGDWSTAIWDPSLRAMVLARDHCGARPLFYCAMPSLLAWSSSLGALVQRLGCYDDLDDEFMIGTLMGLQMPTRTPYRGICSVPTGTAMVWGHDGHRHAITLWSASYRELHLNTVSDYADELRRLFGEAVKARLRYKGTVWAELSGGLDSSSVVCMADRLIRNHAVKATDLETVSFFSEGLAASDERPYIRTVEQHVDRVGHHLPYDAYVGHKDDRWGWVSPSHRDGVGYAVCQLVRRNGGSTLLTGDGGDAIMGNSVGGPHDVAAHLRRGRCGQAIAVARAEARVLKGTVYSVLFEAALVLIANKWTTAYRLRRLLAALGAEHGSLLRRIGDTWLVPDTYSELWIQGTRRQLEAGRDYPDWTKMEVLRYLLGFADRAASLCELDGIAATHPMTHRPLVEFVLGIPSTIWRPIGQPRALMRTAFESFMPARIVRRRSKGDPSPTFVRHAGSLAEDWLAKINALHVISRGYIDRERLRLKLVSVRNGCCPSVMPLPMLFHVEAWLETRDAQIAKAKAQAVANVEHDAPTRPRLTQASASGPAEHPDEKVYAGQRVASAHT